MSVFIRPSYFLLYEGSWCHMSRKTLTSAFSGEMEPAFHSDSSAVEADFTQLINALRQQNSAVSTLLLPDCLLQTYQHPLEEILPAKLLGMAAHAYAQLAISYSEKEHLLSYYQDKDKAPYTLYIAVLPVTYFKKLKQLGVRNIASERLFRLSKLGGGGVHSRHTVVFHPYSESYLQLQQQNKQCRRLIGIFLLLTTLGGIGASYLWLDMPARVERFHWGWPEPSAAIINTGLLYIRALPRTMRLERIDFQSNYVRLELTGPSSELILWYENWPSSLPPLAVKLNGEVWQ